MTVTVTVDITLEILGDDLWTGPPNKYWGQIPVSPANIWQYVLQGPSGSTTPVDNVILVPGWLPTTPLQLQGASASFFWIDPQPVWGVSASGATFVLKGSTADVGIPLSSYNPSLIPIAQSNGGSYNASSGQWQPTPQTDFDLQSSQTVQLQVGWF